jgi:hypothetical protein
MAHTNQTDADDAWIEQGLLFACALHGASDLILMRVAVTALAGARSTR